MDLIKDFLNSEGSQVIKQLLDSGFDAEQAKKFIPEAGESVLSALKEGNVGDVLESPPENQISSLLQNIDVGALASRVGIDADTATAGLQTVIPSLLSYISEHAGGLTGLLSMLGGQKAGGVAGLFKGLFNR